MTFSRFLWSSKSVLSVLLLIQSVTGNGIRINEVADKGTSDACNGVDWIELYLPGDATEPIDLTGYVLHDDNGPDDPDAFTFAGGTVVQPGEYLLLCNEGVDATTSPQFGIGGDDTVTLRDPSGSVVSTTGVMRNLGDVDVTFAFDESSSTDDVTTQTLTTYRYTSTPTPGAANVITPVPGDETVEEMRARLVAQNQEGIAFFNMDTMGLPVEDGFPSVVDLRMEMAPEAKDAISGDERGYEVYSSFLSATVTALDDPNTVYLNLTSPGRIRPKGQSTMYFGVCMNRTTPYNIEWDTTDADQTLFGAQQTYLRTAWGDPSYVREWAVHRMLARFGLPHLRTRTVRFFVNDEYYGLYSLMEAPEQDYVFQRSFPDFDRDNYGLYKVKTQSIGCGMYDDASLAKAEARIDETATPPYVFERGEHRPIPPVLGEQEACFGPFIQSIAVNETADVVLAYVRHGAGNCGDFLVDEGLIERDLGVKAMDSPMSAFIDAHLAGNICSDSECSNSNLANDVNVTQFLRNFATYAALLNMDSPLGNGNNYYLANPGNGGGWSIVQYDHNNMLSSLSSDLCGGGCYDHLVKWSILRPTCRGLSTSQMGGPLLSDDALRASYVEYVRQFVNEVMTNEDFLTQLREHMESMKDLIPEDPWADFAPVFESYELEGDQWLHNITDDFPYVPFLPALRARTTEIQKQLEAIDSDTFPRSLDEINDGEICVDWEIASAPKFDCPNNCFYEGCATPFGITAQAFCDPASKLCFVGTLDDQCVGVPEGEPYPGNGPDENAFCLSFPPIGLPIKAAMCPPYAVSDGATDNGSTADNGDATVGNGNESTGNETTGSDGSSTDDSDRSSSSSSIGLSTYDSSLICRSFTIAFLLVAWAGLP